MPARAMWKGVLALKNIKIPVKLYSAVQEQGIHFRMLHDQDMVPIQQRMVDPTTGDEVPYKEAVRAALMDEGQYVIVRPSELDELEPEESRTITIERFVPKEKITHQQYDRPYYLGPDERFEDEYWALVEALKDQDREGLARWVMRKREYIGALNVSNGCLMLITLRPVTELVSPKSFNLLGGRQMSAAEVKMARQLVSMLEGEFDPTEYKDEFRDRVLSFIESKARGKKIRLPKAERKKPASTNIADLLSASLKHVHREHADA
jgi:DNA end-binding protein Ku